MKYIAIVVISFLSISSTKSQEFFLGKSKNYITDSLAKLHYFPERLGKKITTDPRSQISIFRPSADSDRSRENAGLLEFQYRNFNYYDTKTYVIKNGDTTGFATRDTTHLFLLNFYIKNDTCFRFFEVLERKELLKTIVYLKSKYKKIDDNHWIDNTGIYEAKLDDRYMNDPLPENLFIIKFKKIGSIQYILPLFPDPY